MFVVRIYAVVFDSIEIFAKNEKIRSVWFR